MSSWESVWFTDHTEQNWKKCLKYSFSYSLTMTISWKIYHGGKFFLWSWGIYTSRARTSRILPCSSNKRWKHLTKFKTCSGQSQDPDSMKSFAIWMELYPPHCHKSLPHRHTGRRNGMTGTLWSSINANAKSWTWYKISPCAGTGDWLAGWTHYRSQQRVPAAMKRNCVLTSAYVQLAGQRNRLFPSIWHLWNQTCSTGIQFGVLQYKKDIKKLKQFQWTDPKVDWGWSPWCTRKSRGHCIGWVSQRKG